MSLLSATSAVPGAPEPNTRAYWSRGREKIGKKHGALKTAEESWPDEFITVPTDVTLLHAWARAVLLVDIMSAEAQAAEVPAAAPADGNTAELGAEVTSAESVEVDPKLKKQLEFYFSDSNLPKDKFLLMQTKKTPEGWVSLKVLTVRGLARVSHRAPY